MGEAEPAPSGVATATAGTIRIRELEIVREIAHAFLTASHALEVYRLALQRLTPLVGASFSSVFLRDATEPDLLRLACAHNWPQSSARYLAQLRIRVGRGPTGRAVADGVAVEVEDLFADPTLREWQEPARELGFAALISLPLMSRDTVGGALTFYYDRAHRFAADERHVLHLLTAQLAAMSGRAQLTDELRAAQQQQQQRHETLLQRITEADELQRLRTEFVANMSHELRTPLTAILGYAALLDEGHAGELSAEQRAVVRKLDGAGQVLLRLIEDLLELSQLRLGRTHVHWADTDAVLLARHAVETTRPPATAVPLAVQPATPRIPVTTDAEKVVRVLSHLIDNALKFTSSGSVEVHVRALPPEDVVEWQVRDTGIGIAAADQKAIFDEFVQVDGTSTRLYGGTGLGLALSLRLAQLVGGDLTIESEPGTGSTFTLRVPRRPAEPG